MVVGMLPSTTHVRCNVQCDMVSSVVTCSSAAFHLIIYIRFVLFKSVGGRGCRWMGFMLFHIYMAQWRAWDIEEGGGPVSHMLSPFNDIPLLLKCRILYLYGNQGNELVPIIITKYITISFLGKMRFWEVGRSLPIL